MKIKGDTYKQRIDYQLSEWVKGISIHNDIEDECCPDFSCCRPDLKSPEEYRKTFKSANNEQREKMLFGFLGSILPENTMLIDGKSEIEEKLN